MRFLVAPSDPDYGSYVVKLMQDLAKSLLEEHTRILAYKESKLQAVICKLQQNHRNLRHKLYLRMSDTDPQLRLVPSMSGDSILADFPEELLPDLPQEQGHRHSPGNMWGFNGLLSTPEGTPRTRTPTRSPVVTPRFANEDSMVLPLTPKEKLSSSLNLTESSLNLMENSSKDPNEQLSEPQRPVQFQNGAPETRRSSESVLDRNSSRGLLGFKLLPDWEFGPEGDMGDTDINNLGTESLERVAASNKSATASATSRSASYGGLVDASLSTHVTKDDSRVEIIDAPEEERGKCSYWVIDPESIKNMVWDIIALPLLLYDLMTIPMQVFDLPKNAMFYEAISKIIMIYWTLDIIKKTFTGFHRSNGRKVLKLRAVMKHYLCSLQLIFDLSVVVMDWLFLIVVHSHALKTLGLARLAKLVRFYHVVHLVRLLRLCKVQQVLDMLQDHTSSAWFALFLNVITKLGMIVAINHLIACAWYYIGISFYTGSDEEGRRNWTSVYFKGIDGWHYKFLTSLHWSVCQFTPGSMSVQPQNPVERGFAVSILLFAMLVFSSFVSSVTNAMATAQSFSHKYRTQIQTFRRFCRQHHISQDLAMRVDRYIDFLPQSNRAEIQFKDVQLLKLLTVPLRNELLTEIYMPYLDVHPFFSKLNKRSKAMMRKLCEAAITQQALSLHDVLFATGQIGTDMYFLSKGSLKYRMKDQGGAYTREYIKEKQFCCEAVLWIRWLHTGTAHVGAETIVMLLHSQRFRDTVSEYHMDKRLVKMYAAVFAENMSRLLKAGQVVSDLISPEELQRGDVGKFLKTQMRGAIHASSDASKGFPIGSEGMPTIQSSELVIEAP